MLANLLKNSILLDEDYPYTIKYIGRIHQEMVNTANIKDKADVIIDDYILLNSHGQNYIINSHIERSENELLVQDLDIKSVNEFEFNENNINENLLSMDTINYYLPTDSKVTFINFEIRNNGDEILSLKNFNLIIHSVDMYTIGNLDGEINEENVSFKDFISTINSEKILDKKEMDVER